MLNQPAIKQFIFIGFSVILLLSAWTCKAKKQGAKPVKKKTFALVKNTPFNSKEYKTDTANFRTRGAGNNALLEDAKKLGLKNARSVMDTLQQTILKIAVVKYVNQTGIKDEQNFINTFDLTLKEVNDELLKNENVFAEKIVKESNNSYTYWAVMELSKHIVLDSIDKKQNGIGLAFDKVKFGKILNEEILELELKK
ncbi:MAG: hypothetical protein H7296_13500 [Bacteroidia bacterium]|nr:hypothetical protein [Bacteroidia bacterium]